jgi:hypothetical protein
LLKLSDCSDRVVDRYDVRKPYFMKFSVFQSIAKLLIALFGLNALLAMSNLWPTPFVYIDSRVAPEFVYTWCLLLGLVAMGGKARLSGRMLSIVAAAYTFLVLGRYFDTTAPALFGRPINLYWDGLQIPRLLWVLSGQYAWWVPPLLLIAITALIVGLYFGVRWALHVCVSIGAPFTHRYRWAQLVTAFFFISSVANFFGAQQTWGYISRPVLPTYWAQAKVLIAALQEGTGKIVVPESPAFTSDLALLKGADFKLFFLESYGAVTYDNAAMKLALSEDRANLLLQAQKAGLTVVSAFVTSTTFGGGTDLAHMALLTGIDTRDPIRHDILLTTNRPTLIRHFNARGYESFGFYPGLDWEWAEGAFFGYQHLIDARAVRYEGPNIGYWKIPDQIALAKFNSLHPITSDSKQRLFLFASSTSHSPFQPVPPYQADWSRMLSRTPFEKGDIDRIERSKTNWLDMTPGYTGMMAYNFKWLSGYFAQKPEREFAMLALGDHQPTSNITGENASWDVPVHFFTSRPELLRRLQAVGFESGLYPKRKAIASLPELTGILLKAFDSGQ